MRLPVLYVALFMGVAVVFARPENEASPVADTKPAAANVVDAKPAAEEEENIRKKRWQWETYYPGINHPIYDGSYQYQSPSSGVHARTRQYSNFNSGVPVIAGFQQTPITGSPYPTQNTVAGFQQTPITGSPYPTQNTGASSHTQMTSASYRNPNTGSFHHTQTAGRTRYGTPIHARTASFDELQAHQRQNERRAYEWEDSDRRDVWGANQWTQNQRGRDDDWRRQQDRRQHEFGRPLPIARDERYQGEGGRQRLPDIIDTDVTGGSEGRTRMSTVSTRYNNPTYDFRPQRFMDQPVHHHRPSSSPLFGSGVPKFPSYPY